jgi:hypothetical protein
LNSGTHAPLESLRQPPHLFFKDYVFILFLFFFNDNQAGPELLGSSNLSTSALLEAIGTYHHLIFSLLRIAGGSRL